MAATPANQSARESTQSIDGLQHSTHTNTHSLPLVQSSMREAEQKVNRYKDGRRGRKVVVFEGVSRRSLARRSNEEPHNPHGHGHAQLNSHGRHGRHGPGSRRRKGKRAPGQGCRVYPWLAMPCAGRVHVKGEAKINGAGHTHSIAPPSFTRRSFAGRHATSPECCREAWKVVSTHWVPPPRTAYKGEAVTLRPRAVQRKAVVVPLLSSKLCYEYMVL